MTNFSPYSLELSDAHLIEASAGTGKTHAITRLYLRLILELELSVPEILVLTFTRSATAELRERIRTTLEMALQALETKACEDRELLDYVRALPQPSEEIEVQLRQAISALDSAAISTIHGFCERVIAKYPQEVGMLGAAKIVADPSGLLHELASEYLEQFAYTLHPLLGRYLLQQGLGVDSLTQLIEKGALRPMVEVIPNPNPETIESALSERNHALEQAALAWKEYREQLSQELLHAESLKRNLYRKPTISALWLPTLDRLQEFHTRTLPEWIAKLTREAIEQGTKKNHDPLSHPFFDAMSALAATEACLVERLNEHLIRIEQDFLEYARSALETQAQNQTMLTYDGLIDRVYLTLTEENHPLRQKLLSDFPAALLDEHQDTDPAQYKIIESIYRNTEQPIFFIGDPKQAIYGFRNADVYAYLQTQDRFKAHKHSLDLNWRSDPPVVQALSALFQNQQAPFRDARLNFVPSRARGSDSTRSHGIEIHFLKRSEFELENDKAIPKSWTYEMLPHLVVDDLVEQLSTKARTTSDFAILCRTNEECALIEAACLEKDLPVSRQPEGDVFDSEVALWLELVLRACTQAVSLPHIRSALLTPLFGWKLQQILALEDKTIAEEWIEKFSAWGEQWQRVGFSSFIGAFLEEAKMITTLGQEENSPRTLIDLEHLLEMLSRIDWEQRYEAPALVVWLSNMRTHIAFRRRVDSEETKLRDAAQKDAIRITTIHRAKGLEYPIVMLPFPWWNSARRHTPAHFRDPEDGDKIVIDLGSETLERSQNLMQEQARAEDLRLLYVALTRAKHECQVYWGAVRGWQDCALGYLLHPERVDAKDPSEDAELLADLAKLRQRSEGSISIVG